MTLSRPEQPDNLGAAHEHCPNRVLLLLYAAQVAGETVDEATLTQVLLAVLDEPDDPKAAQTKGVAISEVEAASKYIVQRFGKSARKVAEQALAEVRMEGKHQGGGGLRSHRWRLLRGGGSEVHRAELWQEPTQGGRAGSGRGASFVWQGGTVAL